METEGLNIVALSGGKDSTALALRLMEVEPKAYTYICTPTGDELPEMVAHWRELGVLLGQPILQLQHKLNLNELIEFYGALPSWRMRWCTRQLKIEVAQAFYMIHPGSTVYVGLRADEAKREGGIYDERIVTQRYPLREWGWGKDEVISYLQQRGVSIPRRTDCARCCFQRLGEWWDLWSDYPETYKAAEEQEIRHGHTFRSPSRDSWPASLAELRVRFEQGAIPLGASTGEDPSEAGKCRTCSL